MSGIEEHQRRDALLGRKYRCKPDVPNAELKVIADQLALQLAHSMEEKLEALNLIAVDVDNMNQTIKQCQLIHARYNDEINGRTTASELHHTIERFERFETEFERLTKKIHRSINDARRSCEKIYNTVSWGYHKSMLQMINDRLSRRYESDATNEN